jgi:hypothetical protein
MFLTRWLRWGRPHEHDFGGAQADIDPISVAVVPPLGQDNPHPHPHLAPPNSGPSDTHGALINALHAQLGGRIAPAPATAPAPSHRGRVGAAVRLVEALRRLESAEASRSRGPQMTVFVALALRELDRLVDTMSYEELWDAFGGPKASRGGLVLTDISKLPTCRVDATVAADMATYVCPVCLDAACVGQTLRILPCSHSFHSMCIDTWLTKQNSCPVCRRGSIEEQLHA